ncbi:MAG: alanine--tRNA ligase [Phycisphaerales bacterium]|nr:alanine--tRNA ligase [Phycisphaerales bacterium]
MRTSTQIRQDFLEFFRQRGHAIVPASPVVPHDDPTLLFTNAGMNQFKDVFLGAGSRPYKRCADSQPCIRAGGKHNDLDDVGHDTYHHTCFEMLGNWSFGDYFKRDAIAWAWELLTKVWGLDPQRLHATYFGGDPKEGLDPDIEARDLWMQVAGLPAERVHPGNKKDNFWEMGDTGPCGPCSEIHIDQTPDKSGGKLVNAGDARVMEIWNLVFIQFNRGNDGKLTPLPEKHVDTGMGFERITSVIQGKSSNYDTDAFTPIFNAIQQVTGAAAYGGRMERDTLTNERGPMNAGESVQHSQVMADVAYRVIADHIRTLSFAIADGCLPDKEGRGYVLRRILRRAVRYGWQYLNMREPFMHRLAPAVVEALGEPFPTLRKSPQKIGEALREEEEGFLRTLGRGIALFDEAADAARSQHHGEISGADAFKLHDTFGFPIDLTEIMARERGLTVDIGEYERLMEDARTKARGASKIQSTYGVLPGDMIAPFGPTDDTPKFTENTIGATVRAIVEFSEGGSPSLLHTGRGLAPGARAAIVLDRTCFYAEQGGQVSDHGVLAGASLRFDVESMLRLGDVVAHVGTLVQGELHVGAAVEAKIDAQRGEVMRNHTATHLLNWALRETLGEHVQQKGSLVDHEKTRFDFSHNKALSPEEIERIEQLVSKRIADNLTVFAAEAPQQDALRINGLRAVFGEKYPDVVRIVSIGAAVDDLLSEPDNAKWRGYSVEFCGGTHVKATGEIEQFVLLGEESVAKGVRRLIGASGPAAALTREIGASLVLRGEQLLAGPAEQFMTQAAEYITATTDASLTLRQRLRIRAIVSEMQERLKQHQKVSAVESQHAARDRAEALLASAMRVGEVTVVIGEMPSVPADQLKHGADIIKQKTGSAAIFFSVCGDDKVTLLAAVSDDLVKRGVKAGDWVKAIAPIVDGNGGGPPTMAQAGGKNPARLAEALAAAREWIEPRVR